METAQTTVVTRYGSVVVRVGADPAGDAARSLATRLRRALAERGSATLAVSGGSTAPAMLAALAGASLDWSAVSVWQVDERIVAADDPARNARQLRSVPGDVRPMPVTDGDLVAAMHRYAAGLPERFDAVHLGLGDDGHTASWPPAPHPDADVAERADQVAIVGTFNGYRRMTLTAGPINHARSRLLLVTGATKASMVRRWLARDAAIPASRVRRTATTLFLDAAAAADLDAPADGRGRQG